MTFHAHTKQHDKILVRCNILFLWRWVQQNLKTDFWRPPRCVTTHRAFTAPEDPSVSVRRHRNEVTYEKYSSKCKMQKRRRSNMGSRADANVVTSHTESVSSCPPGIIPPETRGPAHLVATCQHPESSNTDMLRQNPRAGKRLGGKLLGSRWFIRRSWTRPLHS